MQENWLPVVGFETSYAVSDHGRVYSFWSKKTLRPGRMPNGHLSVALGRGNSRCVHDLVLSAFVGPRPTGHDGRHLNGVPSDNRLSNLEWSTRKRNSQDKKWHNGAKGYKLTPEHVVLIKRFLAEGVRGATIARAFGVNRNTVYKIAAGRIHEDV